MRVLIVDDEPAILNAYRRTFVLSPEAEAVTRPDACGGRPDDEGERSTVFDCVYHEQGLDAVAEVERALAAGDPFPVAFIGLRMPPGIDGKETARRIRLLDPAISIVIVTSHSGFSPAEISKVAGPADKVFYLAKPFEEGEVVQMAVALGRRWEVDRELVAAREVMARQIVQLEEQALELAANERRALHLASHDTVTDAPNRLAFQQALAERARRPGPFAIALVDLDRFKLVNDTLGHMAGDELVRTICTILQAEVPEGGLVARLGGDEFGLLFDTAGEEAAALDCARIVVACHISTRILGHSVHVCASAGVTVGGDGSSRDPVDMMRRADLALYEAKRSGRNNARLFDISMDQGIRLRGRIESDLSQAIARDELGMVFQPIVTNGSYEVVGFEALVRWYTEEYGPISPATFIPIAEESNLIHELGDWILAKSLEVLKEWPGQYVSVNFSPRQFRRHNFVGYIMEQVERAGIEPHRLQIEITETAIFDDAEHAAETLYRLRQMGFRIALDDFGTGYSSLYNIRKFALDSLKVDRSFIDGMGRERESAAIVHSIIHLGQALGLGVIAEGVETEAQVMLLRAAGASHLQGYYFSQPVMAAEARILATTGFSREHDLGEATRAAGAA